ncbi:MAG: NAD-dependent epimerase/dehydratase family protein [Flavobacteriales bacterium]|nr:NAD-dependent epimerase/dehydratase family protein [Flavobacteriales bacterium]MCB9193514.1 NAD-dependent epimerase/dehydratase family protein [Flavobacteriales bacterium]
MAATNGMRILVLGGTRFIGRHVVERLWGRHDLTLFHRGVTGADLFPDVPRIRGDRDTADIARIADTPWDAVIDLSCYFPAQLAGVLEQLGDRPTRYVFVSTCSVYDPEDRSVLRDEEARTLPCTAAQATDPAPATYGHRKAACERLLARSGRPHAILRPALVHGPHDPTDRLYYWLHQVMRHHTLLLPDGGRRTFSLTYVRDLAEMLAGALTCTGPHTVFNAISTPRASIRMVVDQAAKLLERDPVIADAPPELLHRHGIRPWADMPLWIDGDHGTYANRRAEEALAGARTPFADSLRTTIAHCAERGWPTPTYGLDEATRQRLLREVAVGEQG